jgi:multiple sugar transport system substrate-binding protein
MFLTVVGFVFSGGAGEKAQKAQELVIWTWLNPEGKSPREVAFKEILTSFKSENPGMKVTIEPVAWQEIETKWRASVETGKYPDVVWLLKAINDRARFLEDLDKSVLSKMPKEDVDDLYVVNTLDSRIGTGTNLAFPIWQSPGSIVYYRKDLFEKAGVKTPIKTWDEFLAAAKKLTMDLNKDGNPDVFGYGDSFGEKFALANIFTYALADLQPEFYDLKNKKALFDTDSALKAAQLCVDLVKTGAMPKDAISIDLETLLQQFAQGRFAMIQGPAHRFGSIKASVGFGKENLGIMPWPSWKGDRMGPAFLGYMWDVAISKNARNPESAALFMKKLMSKDSSKIWMEIGQQVPNRKSLMSAPFLSQPENEVLAMGLKIITANAIYPQPAGMNTQLVAPSIGEAVMKMMLDGTVNREYLIKANERINASQDK